MKNKITNTNRILFYIIIFILLLIISNTSCTKIYIKKAVIPNNEKNFDKCVEESILKIRKKMKEEGDCIEYNRYDLTDTINGEIYTLKDKFTTKLNINILLSNFVKKKESGIQENVVVVWYTLFNESCLNDMNEINLLIEEIDTLCKKYSLYKERIYNNLAIELMDQCKSKLIEILLLRLIEYQESDFEYDEKNCNYFVNDNCYCHSKGRKLMSYQQNIAYYYYTNKKFIKAKEYYLKAIQTNIKYDRCDTEMNIPQQRLYKICPKIDSNIMKKIIDIDLYLGNFTIAQKRLHALWSLRSEGPLQDFFLDDEWSFLNNWGMRAR